MIAVMVAGRPRASPMSTRSLERPRADRYAAAHAVLFALAMSSGTPMDGANMRATVRAPVRPSSGGVTKA
ncbi:hypothetical protein EV651_10462 [Kribbella sp. VKM Ac-2571]|nr:hypothetical protein EV651_10462 [Kribbella sp. VKM Ac-2571]